MRERFPKRKKTKRQKVLEYTCLRCGDRHPFNRYCPYAIEPPITPGECRSCVTLMNIHDDGCKLVVIKDHIGLCAFCGDISHLYAECPERYPNQGPKRIIERPAMIRKPTYDEDQNPAAPEPPLYYGICSFCGSAGHGHEECLSLKEAVREQAAQMAQLQIAKYKAARVVPQGQGDQTGIGRETERKWIPREAGGHYQGPSGMGTISGGKGDPDPGNGGDDDPRTTKGVAGTPKIGGGPICFEEMGEAHQMIWILGTEMGSPGTPAEDEDLGAIQDPRDRKAPEGPRGHQDKRETRGRDML